MEKHKIQHVDLPIFYGNNNFRGLINEVKLDFKEFFQSENKYYEVIGRIESTVFTYAQQTLVYGKELPKQIVKTALSYLYNSIDVDKNKTISVLGKVAEDSDAVLSLFWSIKKRMNKIIDDVPSKSFLTRDKAAELIDILDGFIEGIVKKEIWFLLAFKDIRDKKNVEPERWRHEGLGNLVSAVAKLPPPLGNFLTDTTLENVSLSQLRNIGAHKDFSVKTETITLGVSKNPKEVSLEELRDILVEIALRRIFLRICINIMMAQFRDELENLGYKPIRTPETLSIDLSAVLAAQNITVEHILRVENDTEIRCRSYGFSKGSSLPMEIIQGCLHEVIHVYDDVFTPNDSDKIRVFVHSEYADEFVFTIERRYAKILYDKKTRPKNGSVIFVEYELNGEKKRMRMIRNPKGWILK